MQAPLSSRFYSLLPAVKLIKLINRQLSWLTGNLTCLRVLGLHSFKKRVQLDGLREPLVYFYALLRAYTRFSGLHSFQGYTVFKFHPLRSRYRDPAASPLNAGQYMFENRAIKLINRQF